MRTDAEVTAAAELTAADEARMVYATAIRERDRARAIAVALEGQMAAVRALADEWEDAEANTYGRALTWAARQIRAALDPDPAKEA